MTRLAGSAKLLRAMNSSATLAHLLQSGQLTRGDLRERTGAPGPAAEIYGPNPDARYVVAVSVRDTTEQDRPDIALALCDLTGAMRDRVERRIDFARVPPGLRL